MNIASYGGTYGEAVKKAWLDPFESETGIKVNLGSNASLALAKLQVSNPGGAEWDIVDLAGPEIELATRENLLLPLDSNVDTTKFYPEFVKPNSIGYAQFIWVVGWNRDKIPDADAPQDWSQLWDTNKYSGKRSLITVRTNGNSLIAALAADGVAPDGIFPLDLDRAFGSFEKLGKDNIIWQNTNQEPIQHLTTGQVDLAGMYTGRALIANRAGANLGFSMNQGLIGGDWLGVMRTARNAEAAFELINYIATRGDRAAEFTELTSYLVPHVELDSLLPADSDVRSAVPTTKEVLDRLIRDDEAYWGDHLETAITRFTEWQLT
ncbi:ABC transporter substrate-binding protein [Mesorhizobium sp. L-8-10]|uniref:extracellular solute-binding protein n=1 Tax=Mesorhizobium sp. L-8-10 TaxID=2744523 RepID=UPI00193621DC|nr:extracellular solute-binding protein [Mesorhizobium sp. L-8-10]BCH29908.1 ABC transporter substrate-binding protein [Mesorhizobium sp. L-8-10]